MKKIDIYKMAGSRLGIGLERLVDGGDVGEVFDVYWGAVLRDVLARHPWAWAVVRRAVVPSRDGTWRLQVPDDFVRFAGLGDEVSLQGEYVYGKGAGEFCYVACDEGFILGSGSFCLALALRLAAECSVAVTGELGVPLLQEYEQSALPRAMMESVNLRGGHYAKGEML